MGRVLLRMRTTRSLVAAAAAVAPQRWLGSAPFRCLPLRRSFGVPVGRGKEVRSRRDSAVQCRDSGIGTRSSSTLRVGSATSGTAQTAPSSSSSPSDKEPGRDEDKSRHYGRNLYITYHELEMALERRGYSLYKLLIGTLIAVASTTALFWNDIKHWGAQESASVATRTLEDEMLQKKAEDLAKQLTNALLTDERTMRAVQTLFKQILSDPSSRRDATMFVTDLLAVLMEREDVKDVSSRFLADVLEFEAVRDASKDLGVWIVGHPFVIERVKESLLKLLEDPDSRAGGTQYAMDATLRTLQDPTTKEWLQNIVEDVFNDPQFQEKAGEALWNATKIGVLGIRSTRQRVAEEIEAIEEMAEEIEAIEEMADEIEAIDELAEEIEAIDEIANEEGRLQEEQRGDTEQKLEGVRNESGATTQSDGDDHHAVDEVPFRDEDAKDGVCDAKSDTGTEAKTDKVEP